MSSLGGVSWGPWVLGFDTGVRGGGLVYGCLRRFFYGGDLGCFIVSRGAYVFTRQFRVVGCGGGWGGEGSRDECRG